MRNPKNHNGLLPHLLGSRYPTGALVIPLIDKTVMHCNTLAVAGTRPETNIKYTTEETLKGYGLETKSMQG